MTQSPSYFWLRPFPFLSIARVSLSSSWHDVFRRPTTNLCFFLPTNPLNRSWFFQEPFFVLYVRKFPRLSAFQCPHPASFFPPHLATFVYNPPVPMPVVLTDGAVDKCPSSSFPDVLIFCGHSYLVSAVLPDPSWRNVPQGAFSPPVFLIFQTDLL